MTCKNMIDRDVCAPYSAGMTTNMHDMHARDGDDLLTPSQVAKFLPYTSVDSVRRWIRSGALPAQSLPNGRYLVRRADAEGLLRPVVAMPVDQSPNGDEVLPGQDFLEWPTAGSEAERR